MKLFELIKNDLVICKCNKIMTLREWQDHNNNSDHDIADPINSTLGKARMRLMN